MSPATDRTKPAVSQTAIREALRSQDYARLIESLDKLDGSTAALYLLEALRIQSPPTVTLAAGLRSALGKRAR